MSSDSDQRRGAVFGLLALGSFLCMAAMALLAMSLVTNHWQEITVDRRTLEGWPSLEQNLDYDLSYVSRDRGIFKICIPGKDTAFFDIAESQGYEIVDGTCVLDPGIYLPTVDERKDWGTENEAREHLIRFHMALFCISLLLLLLAVSFGGLSCLHVTPNHMTMAGVVALIAAFSTFGGMGVFHGYTYLEDNKINKPVFKHFWGNITPLASYTTVDFGYSYILGWVSGAVSMLTAIVYLVAGSQAKENLLKKKMSDKASLMPRHGMRPQPHMMMPGDYPTLPQPNRPRAPPSMFYVNPPQHH